MTNTISITAGHLEVGDTIADDGTIEAIKLGVCAGHPVVRASVVLPGVRRWMTFDPRDNVTISARNA